MYSAYIMVAVVVSLLVYREWENRKMIDSLLNRLMSRDFREYKIVTEIQPRPRKAPRVGAMTDEVLAEREAARSEE